MKKNVVTYDGLTGYPMVSQDVIESLETNGTYLPDVVRVVYNLQTVKRIHEKGDDGKDIIKTEVLENPILVTKVWWADNTSTTVRNSAHDKVETEEVQLEDGRTVTVATECAKEFGLMAAVTKRTCGIPDDNGEMTETNMGKIITDIVKSAYDQNLEAAKAKIQKAKRKAELEAKKAEPKKAKAKRYSYNDLTQFAGPILEAFAKKIAENPEYLQNLLKTVTEKTGA